MRLSVSYLMLNVVEIGLPCVEIMLILPAVVSTIAIIKVDY